MISKAMLIGRSRRRWGMGRALMMPSEVDCGVVRNGLCGSRRSTTFQA
jgi:hypothetical protein